MLKIILCLMYLTSSYEVDTERNGPIIGRLSTVQLFRWKTGSRRPDPAWDAEHQTSVDRSEIEQSSSCLVTEKCPHIRDIRHPLRAPATHESSEDIFLPISQSREKQVRSWQWWKQDQNVKTKTKIKTKTIRSRPRPSKQQQDYITKKTLLL